MYQIKRYSEEDELPQVPFPVKLALFLGCVFAGSTNGLLVASIKADNSDKLPFSGLSVVFLVEVLKLLMSAIMQSASGLPLCQRVDMMFAVPGALYMVVDNLYFVMVAYINPATQQLLWNMKIIWTTLLLSCVMKAHVAGMQWLAITLLVGALVLAKYDRVFTSTDDTTEAQHQNFLIGSLLCLAGSWLVSCGNVGCEWLMKKTADQSLHWQNMQLYMFGIVFSLLGLFMRLRNDDSDKSSTELVFAGFEWRIWAIICIQAFGGILIGAMFKYTDNLLVLFAHVCAMFAVSIGSWIWFGFVMKWNFLVGLALASGSLWMFFHFKSIPVHDEPDDEEHEGPYDSGMAFFTVADELDEAFGDAAYGDAMGNEYGEDAPFL